MGYTAPAEVCKSAIMSRTASLTIILLLLAGGIYFLSTMPKQQPTKTIEVDVPQGGNAQ